MFLDQKTGPYYIEDKEMVEMIGDSDFIVCQNTDPKFDDSKHIISNCFLI